MLNAACENADLRSIVLTDHVNIEKSRGHSAKN